MIFIEHKLTYRQTGDVPEDDFVIPIGVADVKREGRDVTVVATSKMIGESLAAAEVVAEERIGVEVVDPRTLMPLDMDTILASLRKTGRLVVVYEGWTTGGYGAEVIARICESGRSSNSGPVAATLALGVVAALIGAVHALKDVVTLSPAVSMRPPAPRTASGCGRSSRCATRPSNGATWGAPSAPRRSATARGAWPCCR